MTTNWRCKEEELHHTCPGVWMARGEHSAHRCTCQCHQTEDDLLERTANSLQ